MPATAFSDYVTTRRRELDMTLGDVASAIGVSPMDVSGWALGESVPDAERLVALAEVFQTPPGKLAEMAGVSLDTPAPPEPTAVEIPEPESPEPVETPVPTAADDLEVAEETPPEPEPAVNLLPEPKDTDTPADDEEGVGEAAPAEGDDPAGDLSNGPDDGSQTASGEQTAEELLTTDPQLEPGVVLAVADAPPEPDAAPAVAAEASPLEDRPARADDPPTFVTPEGRADQMSGAIPMGYVQDSQKMLRYRIRWAITTVVLVILFFIGLWASRELIDALSLVFEAVTP